jgi:hypothetical protein
MDPAPSCDVKREGPLCSYDKELVIEKRYNSGAGLKEPDDHE